MEPIGCPETLVKIYHYLLPNNREECSSHEYYLKRKRYSYERNTACLKISVYFPVAKIYKINF
jgi:hypothetical protein